MKKICGIYCIENTVTIKRYIGQSVDIYRRWRNHKSNLLNKKHQNYMLQEDYDLYGLESFKFYILEECDANDLNQREMYYISLYDSDDNFYGYNIESGGNNSPLAESTKKKISLSKTSISEEQKIINRIKNKKAHLFESHPIYQITLAGEIYKEWNSARDAARTLKYTQSCIWNCLNNNRRTYKNYIWIYKDKYDDSFDINDYINKQGQSIKICQYDFDGNLVKIWNSSYDASRELNIDVSSIIKTCKGKYKYCKDFVWSYYYKEPDFSFINDKHINHKIGVYDLNGKLVDILNSRKEVVEKYNISQSSLSFCLTGKQSSCKGYAYKFILN